MNRFFFWPALACVAVAASCMPLRAADPKKEEKPPVVVELKIEPPKAARGATVNFTITARNTTAETQALNFRSGQNFDITATPENKKEPVWRWANDKIFTMALRSVKLGPNEAKTWTATWNQTDNEGNTIVRGKYSIEAWLTANGNLKAPADTLELTN